MLAALAVDADAFQLDVEGDRTCDVADREVAAHRVLLLPFREDSGALEHDLGILLDIEEVRRTEVSVAARVAGVDRAHVGERRPCPADARGQLIVMTAQGRRVLRRSAPEHFRSIARNFADHLTDREVEVITTTLERVAQAAGRG